MFNIIKFYKDYRINTANPGNRHYRNGWLNSPCPFCHGKDNYLGVHISSGAINCWKCGPHNTTELIKALLNVDWQTAKETIEEYTTEQRLRNRTQAPIYHLQGKNKICEYPYGSSPLNDRHKAYLEGRGFDANHLEKVWGLLGTGNIGDYKFRVIAPIMFDGIMVSYQGRDITEKSNLRYKACKKENEVIEHQLILYGLDQAKGDKCLVVEGLFDVWRFGPGAVSCFGTAFTTSQTNLLAERFKFIFVLFDADDDNAMKMARELGVELSGRGVIVELLDISDTPPEKLIDPKKGIDPANLKQDYANQIMKELGFI